VTEQGNQGEAQQPSPEEVRDALEEELRKVRVEDLLVQSAASIVSLTARRIGKEDERDLEQARTGIEAVRALVGLLPEEAAKQVQEAISQLQILYAQAARGEGPTGQQEASSKEAAEPSAPPGRGEPPPRLWTPPGSR
jgi:hypothetical protein